MWKWKCNPRSRFDPKVRDPSLQISITAESPAAEPLERIWTVCDVMTLKETPSESPHHYGRNLESTGESDPPLASGYFLSCCKQDGKSATIPDEQIRRQPSPHSALHDVSGNLENSLPVADQICDSPSRTRHSSESTQASVNPVKPIEHLGSSFIVLISCGIDRDRFAILEEDKHGPDMRGTKDDQARQKGVEQEDLGRWAREVSQGKKFWGIIARRQKCDEILMRKT
jgi:hypothetical protein